MSLNFYDAIVLGADVPSLLTAALMARRGLRLLVLGQGTGGGYTYLGGPQGDLALPRCPFPMLASESPALKRVFSELSLLQLLRRRLSPQRPAFQTVLPGHRYDVDDDPDLFLRELSREFPGDAAELRPLIDHFDRADEELDTLFGQDLVLPPYKWGEKREFGRALSRVSLLKTQPDPLGALAENHLLRVLFAAPLAFAGDLDVGTTSWLARVRLLGHFRRGAQQLSGGAEALRNLLLDRIRSAGGEIREKHSASAIVLRRGRAAGVQLGDEEIIGTEAVVAGVGIERTLELLGDEQPKKLVQAAQAMAPVRRRYVVNVVLDQAGLPEGMSSTVFAVADPTAELAGANLIWLQLAEAEAESPRRVVTVSCLAPPDTTPGDARLPALREGIVKHLAEVMPFFERHLVTIDSPHEEPRHPGKGPKGAPARRPLPLSPVYGESDGLWGVAGIGVRTGIKQLYVIGRQVLPGLGLEGDFLTAWSAARLVADASGRKDLLRSQVLIGQD